MFAFIPQLLIVLSLGGIIFIVLRKTPEITEFFKTTPFKEMAGTIWRWILYLGRKLWHFVLEVKGLRRPSFMHLPKSFGKIHMPRPKFRFFGSPDTPEFYLSKAEESILAEDYAEAERRFIKVIEKEPHNEAAFAGLGKLYSIQKKFREAIETYKFLVKHHQNNDSYYANLGQAYHNEKLYDQAVDAYEKAIELAPQIGKRYVNLGLTLEAKKHLEEAILNHRRAVDLEANNTQFLMVLAEALVKKGEKDEAELLLEKILQLEPTNHLAREKLMQLKF